MRIIRFGARMAWSLTAAILCFGNSAGPAWGEDKQPASKAVPAQAAVAGDYKELAFELKEFRHSLNELKRSGRSLIGEFQRSESKILEFNDFINDYIDDKPVPYQEQLYQYGSQNMGNTGVTATPLPPRKEWVDHYRSNITDLAGLAQAELNDILTKLPAGTPNQAAADCQDIMSRLTQTTEQVKALTDRSDKDKSQHLIADLLDEVHQLELSTKRLVLRQVGQHKLK